MSVFVPGRISVVIPCYNAAAFIARAVDSVLGQTHPDVELVLVDDCSSDDLQQALEPYAGRFVLSRNPANVGTSASRNNGAALATGEKLAFLDQDDWWPPDLLARLAGACGDGTVACYDNYLLGEGDLAASESEWQTRPTVFSQAQPWNAAKVTWDSMDAMFAGAPMLKILVHQADFARAGGYDARFYGVEDFHFAVKLLAARATLHLLPQVKGYYLDHAGSTSASIKADESKQANSCAVWLAMNRALPQELSLPPAAALCCRRGERYWAMRAADLHLRRHMREKQLGPLLRWDFLREFLPALPAWCAMKAQSLRRKGQRALRP